MECFEQLRFVAMQSSLGNGLTIKKVIISRIRLHSTLQICPTTFSKIYKQIQLKLTINNLMKTLSQLPAQ